MEADALAGLAYKSTYKLIKESMVNKTIRVTEEKFRTRKRNR